MESVGIEGLAGVRSGWRMPRALAVVWVIKEKITALYCVWFSFWLWGRVVVVGAAMKSDKKISKKEKEVECLDRIFGYWVAE